MTLLHKPSRTAYILAYAAIYIIWGSTYLGIRVAVQTLPPFLMAGARFAIAGVLLFTFLKLRGAAWPSLRQWRDQSIAGIFLLLGGNAVVTWSEQTVTSGVTSLIAGASPLMVVLLDWIRPGGRRPTLGLVVGVLVGVGGIFMLLGPGAIPQGYRPPALSIAALFLASTSWWIGSFYSKHSGSGTPLMMASAMQMLVGSSTMLLTGWLLGEFAGFSPSVVSVHSWTAFAYLVTVGSLLAFPVYVWLLEHSTTAQVSTYAYVNPAVAVFLGWAILGEPLNPRMLAAVAVIIGSVALITIGKTRTNASN